MYTIRITPIKKISHKDLVVYIPSKDTDRKKGIWPIVEHI